MANEESSEVILYVYDLSQGMARMLSMPLAGRQIDAIYHTSVVVYGTEYFFGQGIMSCAPGQSMHGTPIEQLRMGTTYLPRSVVREYIDNMRQHWTADRYHLLDNNCNSFSDEVCTFLVGKNIPSHITGLPADFLSTPLGQQFRPMIEAMFGPSRHGRDTGGWNDGPINGFGAAPAGANGVSHGAVPPVAAGPGALTVDTHPSAKAYVPASSLAQLEGIVSSQRAVVAFFTRDGCGPCKMIEPRLKELVDEINSEFVQAGRRRGAAEPYITAVRVDTGVAFDAATRYSVTATPTFIFFLDGEKYYDFKGANAAELKTSLYGVVGKAFPPHPHAKVSTPTANALGTAPHVHPPVGDLDKLGAKLGEFAVGAGVVSAAEWASTGTGLVAAAKDPKRPLPKGWEDFAARLLKLDVDKVFPALDLLRMLLSQPDVASWTAGGGFKPLMHLVRELGANPSTPRAARLTLLKLACSFPTTSAFSSRALDESDGGITTRTLTTALLVESLLHEDASIRQAAAGLAWNAALAVAAGREGSTVPAALWPRGSAEDEQEWAIELASACSSTLERDEGDEVRLRLAGALVHIVKYGTADLAELIRVMGVCDFLKADPDGGEGEKDKERRARVVKIAKELEALINAV
ncbi:PPPDE putative peptidase domain-containing protein [Hyaloraphidium curvatum]|nr:PPPDE putative peptidase domain-containing protein [Hyaloraphidium curvatum]